jgi:hypothetical protein
MRTERAVSSTGGLRRRGAEMNVVMWFVQVLLAMATFVAYGRYVLVPA